MKGDGGGSGRDGGRAVPTIVKSIDAHLEAARAADRPTNWTAGDGASSRRQVS